MNSIETAIESLGPHGFGHILLEMHPEDLGTLAKVSKMWRDYLLFENNWKRLAARDFPFLRELGQYDSWRELYITEYQKTGSAPVIDYHFGRIIHGFIEGLRSTPDNRLERFLRKNRLSNDYLRKRYAVTKGSYSIHQHKHTSVVGECLEGGLHLSRIKAVLEMGANPNLVSQTVDTNGAPWLPIEWAVSKKNIEVARLLIRYGASRNILLLKSAAVKWLDGVQMAVEEGAPLDRLDQSSRTALHHLIGFRFEPGFICPRRPQVKKPEQPSKIIDLAKLMVKKTPLYQPDRYGFTVYHYAQLASKMFEELAELDSLIPPPTSGAVKEYKICYNCEQILDSEMQAKETKNCFPGYYRPVSDHTHQEHQLIGFIGKLDTKETLQQISRNSLWNK